ncbi:flagellar biosynthetic protein FliR [Actibacterium sp. 188UL27-1]|uniref:flagellar biosynthetic protein FliR n=1 Tax=Actibacterium sp. 188UL27-1 TaxID=2786961 RepID=UPI00195BDF79|nr:flagellar biosynthetic protein FliR [Actibacterium sp. 188UL27-1]MBM7066215.1 flagellar biosynthetic protein FliR [Actibacterium sp. 188UL27-1]
MIDALAQIVPVAKDGLWHAVLIFLRVGAAFAVLPVFGERSIPQNIRLVLALAMTVILLPMTETATSLVMDRLPVTWLMVSEAIIGLAFGLSIRLMIIALQVAGSIAANATSLSQIFGASPMVEAQPAIGQLLVVAGLTIAVIADLHLRLIEAVLLTYEIFPPGAAMGGAQLGEWGTGTVARSFSLGFTLAAPFVVASFIYNLALGAINKAMPQLMVVLVGAPAITAAGLGLLMLCAPLMLQFWLTALNARLAAPFGG